MIFGSRDSVLHALAQTQPGQAGPTAVRCSNFQASFRLLMAITLIVAMVSTVHAEPIPPTYSVADLGSGSATYSKDASGNGIVIAPDGRTAYAFPQTFTGTSISTPTSFPILDPVPSGLPATQPGYTAFGYSNVQGVTLYPNGIATATDLVGYSSQPGSSWDRHDLYYVPRNPDGSWGQPVAILQGLPVTGQVIGGNTSTILGLSKTGNILMSESGYGPTGYVNSASVFNINTQTSTNLTTFPILVNNNYSNIQAIAIDDQGRILVDATHPGNSPSQPYTEDTLLLTPSGVTSDPIILSTPEPGSWAVMAIAVAAFAAHRARGRRRRVQACPSNSAFVTASGLRVRIR
jgi:hypothetical protein